MPYNVPATEGPIGHSFEAWSNTVSGDVVVQAQPIAIAAAAYEESKDSER